MKSQIEISKKKDWFIMLYEFLGVLLIIFLVFIFGFKISQEVMFWIGGIFFIILILTWIILKSKWRRK